MRDDSSTRVKQRLLIQVRRIVGFRRRLLEWFAREGRSFPWRSPTASNYARVISEILLQRTRAEVVAKFMPLFLECFPCWRKLADAKDSDLQTLLGPLGLWRRRAKSLKALAGEMERRDGRFPSTREEVETLPGVGQYVGSAVLLFSHGAPEPLLDVNMTRVLERFFGPRELVDIRCDPWLQALARRVVKHEKAADVNWTILDLAAKTCVVRGPRCGLCPLHRSCQHALGSGHVE